MSRLRAYAQLIRLPNLPTAWADICMAALVVAVHAPIMAALGGFPWGAFLLILAGSSCLYAAGMVWNDYFDLEQDRLERPHRPIPSKRVGRGEAALLGLILFACGLLCTWLVGPASFRLSVALVGAILLYDRYLKRGIFGPVGMGICRFLNVLLGLSMAGASGATWSLLMAFVVGLYIVGVTWFARTEARMSEQWALRGASIVMAVSLVLALPLPVLRESSSSSFLFPYLLVVFGFFLGLPLIRAIRSPTPPKVQGAVKRCLMGLIVLDAILATALAGLWGLLLLLLILPVMALRRAKWLYAT